MVLGLIVLLPFLGSLAAAFLPPHARAAASWLAGLVALYLRRSEPVRRQWPWAVLAGAAAGCFYLTREESLWILPSVALLGGACLFGAWRLSRATVIRSGALLALEAPVPIDMLRLFEQVRLAVPSPALSAAGESTVFRPPN